MLDAKILDDAKTEGRISERLLIGLRILTNCDNWKKVNPIGAINHKTSLSRYQGMLVELDSRVYFMRQETLEAIKQELMKDAKWKSPKQLTIE